jgi:hypothetical protein
MSTDSPVSPPDGLSGITSVGFALTVDNNAALTDVDGLSGITSVGNSLFVQNNLVLDEFCGLFPLLDAGGLDNVSGNLANPTEADILAAGACPPPTGVFTPVSVVSTSEWPGGATDGRVANLIDGSGLSGLGDIEEQAHGGDSNAATMWHAGASDGGLGGPTGSPPLVADQAVVFDLGSTHTLDRAIVWNHAQLNLTDRGVDVFEMLVSTDADPLTASYTSLGDFQLRESALFGAAPQTLLFPDVAARLVKFDIASAHSGAASEYVGLSEVRFGFELDCPIHRWRFDEAAAAAPDGTTVFEDHCAIDGTVRGAGATSTGAGLSLPGGASGSGAGYVDLDNGLVSGLTNATFEAWFEIDGAHPWARLFDFGASGGNEVPPGPGGAGTNYVFYSVSRFADINLQRTALSAGGNFLVLDDGLATSLAQPYHVAVTFDADGGGPGIAQITTYRDGVQVNQGTVAGGSLADVDDVNAWLGRSNFSADGFLQATLDEFRLYDEALTSDQVDFSFQQGPDTTTVQLPEPGVSLGLGAGVLLLGALARRRRAASGRRR